MPRSLLQVTVALPPVAPDALFALDAGPRTLWEPRAPHPTAAAFAGTGVAHHIEPSGADRFEAALAAADALWAGLEDVRDPGCEDAPPPMLFGGFAFTPRARWTTPWTSFGDASFVLPRVLLVRGPAGTFLRVTGPTERGVAALRTEARLLAARLAAAETSSRTRAGARGSASTGAETRVEHMGRGPWRSLVTDALRSIADHDLDKLVTARCSVVSMPAPIDVRETIARLRGPAQPGVLFAHERDGATFLGLSPERLVARRGARVTTEALAGTGADPEALAASDKDRREHAFVADGVCRALAPLCSVIESPARPHIRALPGLCHLWTPIEAELARPTHVLELVRRLHPTPAVAGTPCSAAVDWITAHEPVPRGWYAGPVGWFDAHGDGDFSVAIRSGVLAGARAWVWAGAGIVPASDPDREYHETQAKQRVLLGALGVTA